MRARSPSSELSGNRPIAALFCATYLRPEMLHIHRHITGLRTFEPLVLAQKTAGRWTGPQPVLVPRSPLRFLGRGLEHLSGRPWQVSLREADRISYSIRQAAVFHVFFGNVAVHMLPALRCCAAPVVLSFHGADVAGAIATAAYAEARREMFSLARLVLCRSAQLAENVASLGCPPEKLRIMRTILPEIEFVPHAPPNDGAWQILQAARLVPKKGLPTALRAFAQFRNSFPAARFLIAGEGPQEAELRGLAASLGIASAVDFAGFLDQDSLGRAFASSHIFVHPSESVGGDVEGIPNAMLEAMAAGLPAVATRHGGIPEVISHGTSGLLCPERDPGALAAALLQLAGDPSLYRTLSQEGSANVKAQFSSAHRISEIEALYREAASPP